MLFTVVWIPFSQRLVSTSIFVVRFSSSTKPDSGVTINAAVSIVTKNTDPCFGIASLATHSVEPFPATVVLQRGIGTNQ